MSQPPYSGPPYQGQPGSGQPYGQQPQGQPGSGQPYGQQPQGQPSSGQPYGQPPYTPPSYNPQQANPQQPGYGQPQQPYTPNDYAAPQTPYGSFPPPPQQPRSRALPITLIIVAIVLVLCGGGSFAAWKYSDNSDKKKAASVTTSTPATTATTDPTTDPTEDPTDDPTTEPPATDDGIKIVQPKTLGGRPALTDAGLAGTADSLKSEFSAIPGATQSVGALYGSIQKNNMVAVAAAKAPIDDPKTELDLLFTGVKSAYAIKGLTAASTGSLGGAAQCGTATVTGVQMAVCAWADKGSFGMIMSYGASLSKAKAEFPTLRSQIEVKS